MLHFALNQNLTNINIRYNGANIQYYDGTQWVDWVSPSGSSYTSVFEKPLTSNTPSNAIITGSGINTSAWYTAFNDIYVTSQQGYIQCMFNEPTYVKVIRAMIKASSTYSVTSTIQVTTDGSTWTTVKQTATIAEITQQADVNTVIKGFKISGGSMGSYAMQMKNIDAMI